MRAYLSLPATLCLLLLTGAASSEEPLPLVHARSSIDFAPPQLALAIEPHLNDAANVTVSVSDAPAIETVLRNALAANDLPRFEAGLARARAIADAMPLGNARNALRREILVDSDIDQVWSFAATDRFGAFYDDEALPGLYDHLTTDYPGYAHAMADLRVVDATGRVLYPTAETRAFLAKQLAAPTKVVHHETVRVAAKRHAQPAPAKVAAVAPQPQPVAAPADALASDIQKAAPPQPAVAPAVTSQPIRANVIATGEPIAAPAETSGGATIFLILLALVAIGVVTVLVRTPKEEPLSLTTPTLVVHEEPPAEKKAS